MILVFKRQSVRHPRIALFFVKFRALSKEHYTNTYTKVSKFHAKWPPKCILHPKVCEKNQRKRQKSIYLTAIIFVLPTEGGRKLSTLLKLSAPYFTFLSHLRPLGPATYSSYFCCCRPISFSSIFGGLSEQARLGMARNP